MVIRIVSLLAALVVCACAAQVPPSAPPTVPVASSPTPRETLDDPRLTEARVAAADKAAWEMLVQRPLRLSTLRNGEPCPLSSSKQISSGLAPALGDGPIYAVTPATRSLSDGGEPRQPDGFYELKVLWVATDAYRDPALIRGARIDKAGPLLFNGRDPEYRLSARSFVFSAGVPRTWRQFPSSTDVRGPGCYAWQLDGTTFADTIVFQVVH